MHPVLAPATGEFDRLGVKARFQIIEQREPFADVGQCHLIAALRTLLAATGIAEIDMQLITTARKANAHIPGSPEGSMPW